MLEHTFTIPVYGEISVRADYISLSGGDGWERKAERMAKDLTTLQDCVDSAGVEIEDGYCDWTDDSFEFSVESLELHVNDDASARLENAAPDLLHALKWAAEFVSLYTADGAGWTGVQQGHDRDRFIADNGDLDPERLRAFIAETITKATTEES